MPETPSDRWLQQCCGSVLTFHEMTTPQEQLFDTVVAGVLEAIKRRFPDVDPEQYRPVVEAQIKRRLANPEI